MTHYDDVKLMEWVTSIVELRRVWKYFVYILAASVS